MRAYVVTTPIGTFGVSEQNKVLVFKPFPTDPPAAAQRLRLAKTELIDEERWVVAELEKAGYAKPIFAVKKPEVELVEPANRAEMWVRQNLRKLAVKHKLVKNQVEFNRLLSLINIELTRAEIRRAIERDRLVIQTSRAIEEIERSLNILAGRLRELYGLHFPEMSRVVESHERYAQIVAQAGHRADITDPQLARLSRVSVGRELTQADVKAVQSLARHILGLFELKSQLESYLDAILREVAPNLRELAEPKLAARLISAAGGLEKLAKLPSSTVQILGAEKSLFRHLKERKRPPKYGLIFVHPLIQQAPRALRGRVARALASKLTIAARIDYYAKEDRSRELKQELNKKIKAILHPKARS
jgi:nucleolar protein 56